MSISKPTNDRIVRASLDTKTEIIGLLLGRLKDDAIIVEDSITGKFHAEKASVTLPAETLAKIADDLTSGRRKGNIVGWYHSHTEGGLFFSETDIQTQKKLQQFSSLIAGMVVDSVTGDVAYFRVDPQSGRAVRIPDEKVRVFSDLSEAVPPVVRFRPTPTIEVRPRSTAPKPQRQSTMIVAILIILIASSAILAAVYYRAVSVRQTLSISHEPVSTATVGTPLEITANVIGSVDTVSLFHATEGAASFDQVEMSSQNPGRYLFILPGEQLTGPISYYIAAKDTSGSEVRTATFHIALSDFTLTTQGRSLTVYKTKSSTMSVTLLMINGFNQQITLSTTGAPEGLTVSFSQNPVPAGTSLVNLNAAADAMATSGTYSMTITATYNPPESPPVSRQELVSITISDFQLQVSPSSRQITTGESTSYTVTLTIQEGFMDPVNLAVTGLPQGAKYQLQSTADTMFFGPGTTSLTLSITTTSSVRSGTYEITVAGTGGGLVRSQTVQLMVR